MGWTSDLLGGLAAMLADAGIGAWHPDGTAYGPAEVAIVLGALPDSPDRAIALAAYPLDDHPSENLVKVGVQVRCRGAGDDPRGADDLGDQVFDLLHGATRFTAGGVHVIQVLRQSSALLGRDALGRWDRADSYHLDAARPTQHRP
jgi:hypothetical protein